MSKESFKWTDDDVIQLLTAAEEYTYLYDTKDERHRDRPLCNTAYKLIAALFPCKYNSVR
jgi:hypothetical protein